MTTTEKPQMTSTLDTTAGADVIGMLVDLARTASTEKPLENLTVIRLHTEGGYLHGWSTDRYRLAHARVRVDGELSGPVCVYAADVKALASSLRRAVLLRVTVTDGMMTVTDFAVTHAVRLAVVQFPNISHLAVTQLPNESVPVMMNAAQLADFCAIAKRRAGRKRPDIEIHTQKGTRPAHVRIGEDYRAWVMPVRFEENADAWMPHAW